MITGITICTMSEPGLAMDMSGTEQTTKNRSGRLTIAPITLWLTPTTPLPSLAPGILGSRWMTTDRIDYLGVAAIVSVVLALVVIVTILFYL